MARLLPPLLLAFLGACARAPEALPRLGEVPGFRLIATDGGKPFPVEKRDLLKKPWVASFLYTSCGGPCPALAATLGGLQERLEGRARLVSFSVDPAADTPAALSDYAREVGAKPGLWWFLTGEKAQIERLVLQGFKLPAARDENRPPSQRVAHSTKLVLVDAGGAIRGYYDSTEARQLEALSRDLGRL